MAALHIYIFQVHALLNYLKKPLFSKYWKSHKYHKLNLKGLWHALEVTLLGFAHTNIHFYVCINLYMYG